MRPFILVLAATALAGAVCAEDWPSFRGPEGTGITLDKEVPLNWDNKTNLRWRCSAAGTWQFDPGGMG